jgi:hypothetical protein
MDMGAARTLSTFTRPARAIELDTFRAAIGLALVAGGLALAFPFFNALAGALVALGGAGWLAARARAGPSGPSPVALAAGWGSAAGGIGAYFALPAPWENARGLVLALCLLPLWLAERRSTRAPGREADR